MRSLRFCTPHALEEQVHSHRCWSVVMQTAAQMCHFSATICFSLCYVTSKTVSDVRDVTAISILCRVFWASRRVEMVKITDISGEYSAPSSEAKSWKNSNLGLIYVGITKCNWPRIHANVTNYKPNCHIVSSNGYPPNSDHN